MTKLTNKTTALIAFAPVLLLFILGFIEGFLGYSDDQTILPISVEAIISVFGFVFGLYSLYRLYHAPEKVESTTIPPPTPSSETIAQ